jgi:hypothetical protein
LDKSDNLAAEKREGKKKSGKKNGQKNKAPNFLPKKLSHEWSVDSTLSRWKVQHSEKQYPAIT